MSQDNTTVWSSLAISGTPTANCIPWIDPNTFQPTNDSVFQYIPASADTLGAGIVYAGGLVPPSINAATPTNPLVRTSARLGLVRNGITLAFGVLHMDYAQAGVAGAYTIHKPAGQVKIAAGASSIVVTNNMVTANSIILCTVASADGTLTFIKNVVAAAGSFTITANAAATADCKINFFIVSTDAIL